MQEFLYFDIEHSVRAHDFIIEKSGGRKGVLDLGKIESVLEHIQNDIYYPELEDKITHLVYSINKLHAFNDGNKRTSIALGAYFLEINGIDYCIDKFIVEMENYAVHVANNIIDKDLLQEIISSILYEDDYSEELKLKIIDGLKQ
ncbi:death-on-curing protein [Roseivirga seohaensis]|uniref:Death-on-curing protein n=1 Tax=Roseivirga seohaensis TaxID=1914963 RepID=A0A150XZH7_9BACT|nr:type II toxin-antitoxin system death-on-curing family toxin [Roseivirga seohaensis]KYG84167.1 death-on-curing protein [Roseivirga seohaensis]